MTTYLEKMKILVRASMTPEELRSRLSSQYERLGFPADEAQKQRYVERGMAFYELEPKGLKAASS